MGPKSKRVEMARNMIKLTVLERALLTSISVPQRPNDWEAIEWYTYSKESVRANPLYTTRGTDI
jgi:hypothetical protein